MPVREAHGDTRRLLVVAPSWVGDAVMATCALRLLRDALPGWYIGALVRPGVDQVLAGLPLLDELHTDRPEGVLGPKRVAARLRPRRYAAALLLANSFSSALVVRVAGVPLRLGYDRDGRRPLLTHRLHAPKRPDGSWQAVPAVAYYLHAARALVGVVGGGAIDPLAPIGPIPADARMELAVTHADQAQAAATLERAGVDPERPYAVLNPGGNNPAKRWPPDRYARLADWLADHYGLPCVVNAAPAEADLARGVRDAARTAPPSLADSGGTLGSLKAVLRGAALLVTNDTGPRHIAAALGTPVVTLFGPTDHRWTTIPAPAGEELVLADPSPPPGRLANDDPERSRIDRIDDPRVREAVARLLTVKAPAPQAEDIP